MPKERVKEGGKELSGNVSAVWQLECSTAIEEQQMKKIMAFGLSSAAALYYCNP